MHIIQIANDGESNLPRPKKIMRDAEDFLACHGLDANDNEFVIGLIGKELHPLSHVVQAMRKTRQTSEFIVQMGPFFVGHAVHRTDGD